MDNKPVISKVTTRIRIVTPLLLGNAMEIRTGEEWFDRQGNSGPIIHIPTELRPPSLKGALRFWIRALHDSDGDGRVLEQRIMGHTQTGRAKAALRILNPAIKDELWHEDSREYIVPHDQWLPNTRYKHNGLAYLGFSNSVKLREGRERVQRIRRYITPSGSFTVLFRGSNEDLKFYTASLWLLTALGGLGSRSRRGFGSLSIESASSEFDLPMLIDSENVQVVADRLSRGLKRIFESLPLRRPSTDARYSALSPNVQLYVYDKLFDTWHDALAEIGLKLQQFRFKKQPDYRDVKSFATSTRGSTPTLRAVPNRVDFGLPLSFKELDRDGAFRGVEHERRASPLFIHVGQLNTSPRAQYYVNLSYLPAPLLPDGEGFWVKSNHIELTKAHAPSTVVTDFLRGLSLIPVAL